ncbi:MAG: DUF4430 domain-containing protein [Lachnospiraceae bacterium]|nr:DUF4430 domain-containing protein [Lachnospiraceae bacterium]NLC74825.1 DUF4430 domain-containing protein [Clostridiales bacterium]
MKKSTRVLSGIALMAAMIALFALVYSKFGPKSDEGSKTYTLEVVDDTGSTASYSGRTDAESLSGIMDELVAEGNFTYDGSDSEYGLFISTVNGITADYDNDGAYWSIMVNGEYGQYGADSQPVSDGDDFELVYEKAQ